jgi:hypothetical protein
MSSTLRTAVLMGAMTAVLIGVGGVIGGQTGMLVALLIAAVTNFGGYWFSDNSRSGCMGPEKLPRPRRRPSPKL